MGTERSRRDFLKLSLTSLAVAAFSSVVGYVPERKTPKLETVGKPRGGSFQFSSTSHPNCRCTLSPVLRHDATTEDIQRALDEMDLGKVEVTQAVGGGPFLLTFKGAQK